MTKKKNAYKNRIVRGGGRRRYLYSLSFPASFFFHVTFQLQFHSFPLYFLMSCRNVSILCIFRSFCICRLSLFASSSFCQYSCTIIAPLFIIMIQTYTNSLLSSRSLYFIIYFFPFAFSFNFIFSICGTYFVRSIISYYFIRLGWPL